MMMDKKIVIDLRWLVFSVVRVVLGVFMLTGVGYLVVKALKGTGWDYSARKPIWKGDCVHFKVSRYSRWAFFILSKWYISEYTVVGGPSEFFINGSGRYAPAQKIMRGFYVQFLHEKPEPIVVNPASSQVTTPSPYQVTIATPSPYTQAPPAVQYQWNPPQQTQDIQYQWNDSSTSNSYRNYSPKRGDIAYDVSSGDMFYASGTLR
jgi:hypothetical protein